MHRHLPRSPCLLGGHRALPYLALAGLLLYVLLPPATVSGAPDVVRLEADGRARRFDVRVPGQPVVFVLRVVAGCRYRLTATPIDLPRLEVEVGPTDRTLYVARASTSATPDDPEADPPRAAVITWDAEADDDLEVRLAGFSVHTGRGTVLVQTLGPDGRPVARHRRLLAPHVARARVGDLWIGEENLWDLVVEAGRRYEVRTNPGTAGRVALRVLGAGGALLAEARPSAEHPYPRLVFDVPPAEVGAEPPALRLAVRGVDEGGGTYGVLLLEDPVDPVSPPAAPPEETPPSLAEGEPLACRLSDGDVAVLHVPVSAPFAPHTIQVLQDDGSWHTLPRTTPTEHGAHARMRTLENAALLWFRAYREGTYRFREPPQSGARLTLLPAALARGAPLLLGTELDPVVRARGQGRWIAIGLAVCMPGWDYLFVAVGGGRTPDMRVTEAAGGVLAYRPVRGLSPTSVQGYGPSLRFQVREPTLVRLEVKGRGWQGHGMLRRASN